MKCLSIHLTDLCNEQCTFCVVGSPLYPRDTIQYDQVVAFLRSHQHDGYGVVNLHGGEPTIHPRFEELLAVVRELGFPEMHLQTNGIRLSDASLVGRCSDLGVTKFIVSLHGDTAEVHDGQTHTRGGLEKTLTAIANMKRHGRHVRTNTVITNQNLSNLGRIASLACDLGVDHLNFSNLHPVGSARFGLNRIMPRFAEVRTHLYPAVDLAVARSRRVTLEGFPFCAIPGKEHLHLDSEYREIKMLMRGHVIDDYDTFMRDDMREFGKPCRRCGVRDRCGGVYPEYLAYNGWSEFAPIAATAPVSIELRRSVRAGVRVT